MKPRFFRLMAAAVLAAGVMAGGMAHAQDARIQEAQTRIANGEALFEAGDFEGALAEFQETHDLLEGHPMQYLTMYNMGRCFERLFRYDQAMLFYRRYLERAGADAEDRAEVQAKISLLEGLLGTVNLSVNVSEYEVWVDERNVGNNLAQVLVPGGTHVVEIRASGYAAAQQEVQVASRAQASLAFTLEEYSAGMHPAFFWASAALAVATVTVGAIFGGLAIQGGNELEEQAGDPVDSWLITQDDLDVVNTRAMVADIMYGCAGLFAITAVVFIFFTNWGGDSDGEEAQEQTARLRFMPSFGPDLAGLAVGGAF